MRPYEPRHRIRHIALACMVIWLVFAVRLFQLQIISHASYEKQALVQHSRRVPLTGVRGTIYDRNGQILAQDIRTSSVCAYPPQIKNKTATARELSSILGIPQGKLLRLLDKKTGYVSIARKVSAETEARLREAKLKDAEAGNHRLDGVGLVDDTRRIYPLGRAACHVVGLVDADGRGIEGIEAQFDQYLSSTRGWFILAQDAKGEELVTSRSLVKEPKAGASVVLTIDSDYQTVAVSCLRRAIERHEAVAGSIIMVEPSTGEILAMVSEPSFEPTDSRTWSKKALRNRVVADQFEPGSTFKLVTLGAVLEEEIADSNTIFFAENGTANFGIHRVNDTSKHGWLTLKQFFSVSSNIVAAKLGMMVGEERFYKYCRTFGFGATTGIDLPGEACGKLRNVADWSQRSLFTMAYGQEISITALQLAMAYAAVANDGVMMRPVIAKRVLDEDGRKLKEWQSRERRRVLSQNTCRAMKDFLVAAVERGTGAPAAVDWCRIGGKTGTAQKYSPVTRSYSLFVSSFAGLVPAEDTRIVCLVVLDEPAKAHLAALVAAPLFKEVVETLIACSRAPLSPPFPEIPFVVQNDDALPVPNVRLLGEDEATKDLTRSGFRARISGVGGRVIEQDPPPGTLARAGSQVRLRLSEIEQLSHGESILPDLRGLSLREALRKLSTLAVRADVRGTGVVATQSPPAGSKIKHGDCCQLDCKPVAEVLGYRIR
jgi:cell division protein FtsI/penicillin-binding protein 2